jgi:anti-anti-sigma factor
MTVGPVSQRTPARAEHIVTLGVLSMRSERDGDVHTITLSGEIDLSNAADVERELMSVEATDAGVILVDLSGLTFMDSTAIRLLVSACARSRAGSGRLALRRPSDGVGRVLRIAGIEHLLPFAD